MMKKAESAARWSELCAGLSFGLIFGLALQRSGVTNYDVILETLLLEDMTVVKVMLTAVLVGAIGIYALRGLGLVKLHVREASFGMNVIGGFIFGAGFAILGYCPGTAVGAIGEGRLDALIGGVLGMLVGTFLFAQAYPDLKKIFRIGDMGTNTVWSMLRVNPWVVIVPLSAGIIALLWWFESIGI